MRSDNEVLMFDKSDGKFLLADKQEIESAQKKLDDILKERQIDFSELSVKEFVKCIFNI